MTIGKGGTSLGRVITDTRAGLLATIMLLLAPRAFGEGGAPASGQDSRVRTAAYAEDVVYRIEGYVGYQIDLQFEPGETFVGLGAGDLRGIRFAAQSNHMFLKPRSAGVETNLTVLTTRRSYQFDYRVSAHRPDTALGDVVYALRFTYPAHADSGPAPDYLEQRLVEAADARPHNLAYAYRGSPALKPVSAWDDGVQTRLRFAPRAELPAIFVQNADGTESLVNSTVGADEIVVHRVARQLIARRGRLTGCIVNEAFNGAGERLDSGTVTPSVERVIKRAPR
jgi:type IV secretion system protein VirB9